MKDLFLIVTLAFVAASICEATRATAQAAAPAPSNSSPAKASPIPPDQQNAHQARELINQAIQALGGQAYLNIHDMQEQGRTYSFYHGRPSSNGVFSGASSSIPTRNGSNSLPSAMSPTSTPATRVTRSLTKARVRWRKRPRRLSAAPQILFGNYVAILGERSDSSAFLTGTRLRAASRPSVSP